MYCLGGGDEWEQALTGSYAGRQKITYSRERIEILKLVIRKECVKNKTFRIDCPEEEAAWTLAFLGADPVAVLLLWKVVKRKIQSWIYFILVQTKLLTKVN